MIQKHWRAIAVALLLLTIIAGTSIADKPEIVHAQLVRVPVSIISKPDPADVYINGKFVGSTDFEQRLAPGVHTIEIRREGYGSWRRELTVTNGNPTRVVALLSKSEK